MMTLATSLCFKTLILKKRSLLDLSSIRLSIIPRIGAHFSHLRSREGTKNPSLSEQLLSRIEVRGPLTVAEYMRAVLTSPSGGYYMFRDVLGRQGDFTTSPEISQLFGEMIGVWFVNELEKFYHSSQPVQWVELGPGRGTLTEDVMRVFKKLGGRDGISVHLVEISPQYSHLQAERLCKRDTIEGHNIFGSKNQPKTLSNDTHVKRQYSIDKDTSDQNMSTGKGNPMSAVTVRRPASLVKNTGPKHYQKGLMKDGTPVFWYYSLQDVPQEFSCILAHEFFDALPIHKFKKTADGWREILITSDPEKGPEHFKFIISRSGTPSSKIFMKPWDERDEVELCPETGLVSQQVATRLEENGGLALIVDYGYEGDGHDTFRAFREHQQVNPLLSPGTADLTADVDFTYIRNAVTDKTVVYGPVSQSYFLRNMGIDVRLKMLMNSSSEDKRFVIKSGFDMIMDSMGDRFKFLSLFPRTLKEHLKKFPVAGFHSL